MGKNKIWLLYDSRYRQNPGRAICFEVCESLSEAKENAPEFGNDTVIVEYDAEGDKLINPKIVN